MRCQGSDQTPNKLKLYNHLLKIPSYVWEDPEGAWPLHRREKDYFFHLLKRRVELNNIKKLYSIVNYIT